MFELIFLTCLSGLRRTVSRSPAAEASYADSVLEIIIAIQNEGSSLKLVLANLDSQSALLLFIHNLTPVSRTSSETSAHLR